MKITISSHVFWHFPDVTKGMAVTWKQDCMSQHCMPPHVLYISLHLLCFLTLALEPCGLTSGSAITISIFFSAKTANSANRLLMTNSPGLSSGSMVMLDMAAMLCFSHDRGVTEAGARRLLTLLLTGAEAKKKKKKKTEGRG